MVKGKSGFESSLVAYLAYLIPVGVWKATDLPKAIKEFDPFANREPMSEKMRRHLEGWKHDKWRGAVRGANASTGR